MRTPIFQKAIALCTGASKGQMRKKEWELHPQDNLQYALSLRPELRCEERVDFPLVCAYEMIEGLAENSVVIHYGQALSRNVSSGGMLLLMDRAPLVRQLIEIHTPISKHRRAMMLFEVRWTRPVQRDGQDYGLMVGCKLTFGPCPYFLFQRERVLPSA